MIQTPMDVLHSFPVRKSRKEKRGFRYAVQTYIEKLGYACKVDKGSFGSRNLVIGDPEKADYLITAHYDTCARLPVPNLITPCNFILYLLYQIGIVILFITAAVVPGCLIGILTRNSALARDISFVCYWLLLFLMFLGPANKNNANDNTSGVVSVLEIAANLPEQHRDKVCFVLFDLEEAGLIGSAAHQHKYKKFTKKQIVLNLDCVGNGDTLFLFPTGKLKKDSKAMDRLRRIQTASGKKCLCVRERGFSFYPSDQSNFPYGVGIAAFSCSKWAGPYLARIHTSKDTILEEENIAILRQSLIDYVTEENEKYSGGNENETV